jgi:hypothetical protein
VYAHKFLENSEKIGSMMEMNTGNEEVNPLGTDENHPLPLDGVTKHDFELLSSLLHPLSVANSYLAA